VPIKLTRADEVPLEQPYTLDEVKHVLRTQAMDRYHRELMWWLVGMVESRQKAKSATKSLRG
jgi:hypothetical protein